MPLQDLTSNQDCTTNHRPRVSIGLPVYNGENFIREELDSILAQTFEDFELIISDNASTDRTEEICKEYAAKDKRIRYYRNQENLGGAWNQNRVFELSCSEYYKMAAHDDMCAPEFLERCVEVLDNNPDVVLSYPRVKHIDEQGKITKNWEWFNDLRPPRLMTKVDSPKPHERFGELIAPHMCHQIFGLIRSSALKQTPLFGYYAAADNVLLVRLALLGRFCEVPEYLLYFRCHQQQAHKVANGDEFKYTQWWRPQSKGQMILPRWKVLSEFIHAINNTPMSWLEKVYCYAHTLRFVRWYRRSLFNELILASQQLLRQRFSPVSGKQKVEQKA